MAGTHDDDDSASVRMMPRPTSVLSNDERNRPVASRKAGHDYNDDEDGYASGSSSSSRHSKCTWFFCLRILDTVLLLFVCIIQGSLLNFLIIWHRQKSHAVYLWFLADFTVVMAFVGALTTSYHRMLRRIQRAFNKTSGTSLSNSSSMNTIPIYGALPLGYLSWLLYSCTLVAKVVTIFTREIDDHLGEEGIFDSQTLKLVIGGGACLVFLLLVNGHQVPSNPNDDRRSYIASLCTGTAFEIFDAIAFLEVLFVNESRIVLPYPLENAILTLVSINLMLPTISLLRLSLADFGIHERPIIIGLAYTSIKLLLIEVPYLVIRAYLWQGYGASTSSIFMLKNILMIVVKIRYIIPEYVALLIRLQAKQRRGDGMDAASIRAGAGQVEMKTIS